MQLEENLTSGGDGNAEQRKPENAAQEFRASRSAVLLQAGVLSKVASDRKDTN